MWLVLRLISPWDLSVVIVLLDVPGQTLIDTLLGPLDPHAATFGLLKFTEDSLAALLRMADAGP